MTRTVLVVGQVSLAFVLLVGAGLPALSFARVLRTDPGFRPERVLTARVSLPQSRYADEAQARNFFARLLESARSLPGVHTAGLTTYLPFGGNTNASVITIVGYTPAPGELPPVPGYNTVDSEYFRVMGIGCATQKWRLSRLPWLFFFCAGFLKVLDTVRQEAPNVGKLAVPGP